MPHTFQMPLRMHFMLEAQSSNVMPCFLPSCCILAISGSVTAIASQHMILATARIGASFLKIPLHKRSLKQSARKSEDESLTKKQREENCLLSTHCKQSMESSSYPLHATTTTTVAVPGNAPSSPKAGLQEIGSYHACLL